MEHDYGPLTIEQAATNVAAHLRLLMLAAANVPPDSDFRNYEAHQAALRMENDLARSLTDYGEAIARGLK